MQQTGAITAYIDVAQIVLYLFWIFFAGLIYYLHRENKREGYPLESDRSQRSSRVVVQGFPRVPQPKTYLLRDGRTVSVPNDLRPAGAALRAEPAGGFLGAPLEPTGNPMFAGVGPGSWSERADLPDTTVDNRARIVPLRAAGGIDVAHLDADPRGMPVIGADGVVGGTVTDVWVDRSEMLFRYLEVGLRDGGRALVPMNFARVKKGRDGGRVLVRSVLGAHLSRVPSTKQRDEITLLEEERVMAFFGAGTLYAQPSRQEPLL